MQRKSMAYVFTFIIFCVIFIASYFWLLQTQHFDNIKMLANENIYSFALLLLFIKVISIVWPPLPGGIFTLGAVPIIGWENAYLIDFVGSMIGSTITFYLGKHYGLPLLKKLFEENVIQKIQKVKVKENRQTELVIVLRIFTGSILMEAITYGAGLLRIRYSSFLVGSIISHAIVGIPVYYFAQAALVNPQSIVLSAVFLVGIFYVLYKVKGRYFE